jgi:ADP-ribosylglycohydrolase
VNGLTWEERVKGCIIGGAVGDALGYPVEFVHSETMSQRGPVTDYAGPRGEWSDDTQMTLFGLEAAPYKSRPRAFEKQIAMAYHRWYLTQTRDEPAAGDEGLLGKEWMHELRAPGFTCLTALSHATGLHAMPTAVEGSKGCGAVMRAAPFGLDPTTTDRRAYWQGFLSGRLTHGHVTAGESAGALSAIIHKIVTGAPIWTAAHDVKRMLTPGGETDRAIDRALQAASLGDPGQQTLELWNGEGWVADECLGIALYACLCHSDNALAALSLAVSHGGDSDSTGAVAGNIIGALLGEDAIPVWLREDLEHYEDLREQAEIFEGKYR